MDISFPEPAIVRPAKRPESPDPGPISVLTATLPDLRALKSRSSATTENSRPVYNGQFCIACEALGRFSMVGPFVGAPYAVMLLETLIAWGGRRFLFWGWCGAVSEAVHIGDIVIPTGAMIDEGTSRHYQTTPSDVSKPSPEMVERLRRTLSPSTKGVHEGLIWTTDAVFRETRDKVRFYQAKGVLAVEMELSALFTVAAVRGVDLGGVLVVSDELSRLTWKPGFKSPEFKAGRMTAADAVVSICRELSR